MSLGTLVKDSAAALRHMARLRAEAPSILFLNQRWGHHGRHSGYLLDSGLGASTPARTDRMLPSPLVAWWRARTGDFQVEQRWLLWLNLCVSGARLLHMVDGDFDLWAFDRRPPLLSTRLTATFHQPPDVLAPIADRLRPGLLDGIICVSRSQLPLLEPLVPSQRCVFIPHGVDTAFFSPAALPRSGDPPVLLCVGAHRRDLRTLVTAARQIRARRPEVVVRLIAPAEKVRLVRETGADAVEVVSGLSDEALRAQYRQAAMLFLPLEETTANNALLEAMACGLPSVVTDLPGARDYAPDSCARYCTLGDPAAHAEAALELLADDARAAEMGRAARTQAELLAWPIIRARALEFMREVMENE